MDISGYKDRAKTNASEGLVMMIIGAIVMASFLGIVLLVLSLGLEFVIEKEVRGYLVNLPGPEMTIYQDDVFPIVGFAVAGVLLFWVGLNKRSSAKATRELIGEIERLRSAGEAEALGRLP